MYCPKCGNQPSTDRVRFCPGCGFRLDGVADLLAHDGAPADNSKVSPTNPLQNREISERKRGVRVGAKMVFISLATFLPFFAFCFVADSPGPLLFPATIFLAGILWMIYYRIFGDEHAPAPKAVQPQYFGPPAQNASFPPPQNPPIYRSPLDTPKEQSVVEHTTRSLEQ